MALTLQGLLDRADNIQREYTKIKSAENPFLNVLIAVHNAIKTMDHGSLSEEKSRQICLATWTVCLENIPKDNYQLVADQIEPELKQISDKHKLICLNSLYHFLFDNKISPDPITEKFKEITLTIPTIEQMLIDHMTQLLKLVSSDIAKIINAIPSKKTLDSQTSNFYEEYQSAIKAKSDANKNSYSLYSFFPSVLNEDRDFLAQLIQGISGIKFDKENKPADALTWADKVSRGLFIYVLQSISDEHYFSYFINSELYKLCSQKFNGIDINNIPNITKLDYLNAFRNFLRDNSYLRKLEDYSYKHFSLEKNSLKDIELRVIKIRQDIKNTMINLSNTTTTWPLLNVFARAVSIFISPTGYGIGYVIGYGVSKTNFTTKPKIELSKGINTLGTAVLGPAGGYGGFLAADFIIESTLTRAFAKALEKIAQIVGFYAIAAPIGLLFDLSYKGLQDLCGFYFQLYNDIHDPVLLKKIDPETHQFMECLSTLPAKIFSEEKKHKIENLIAPDTSESKEEIEDPLKTYAFGKRF